MLSKGQSFMPDFIGSLFVFSIVLSMFIFSWNSIQSHQNQFDLEEETRQDAFYSTTFLVSTAGYPQDWNSSNVSIPGFAVQDNKLSMRKIQEFGELTYSEQKRLLQTEEFSLNITFTEEDRRVSFGNYSSNAEFSTPVTRTVLVRELEAADEIIYTYSPDPEKEDNVYYFNFTIQPGSQTIGNSLDSLDIDIDSRSDLFSNTSKEDVLEAGVDKDQDGEIETNIKQDIDQWTVTDSGSDLKIGFGGSAYTETEASHSILVELADVTNPTRGSYEVEIQTSGDGNWQNGQLEVGEGNVDYETHEAELELVFWRG